MQRSALRSRLALLAALASGLALPAQQNPAAADADAGYRLAIRDLVEITIFDEADLTANQRIDANGQIRVPLLGTVTVAGRTVREAEDLVEALYVEKRILRSPMASARVLEYAAREVNVLGEVGSAGAILFPPETSQMDIVDVIAKAGGFTPMARRNRVQVTRLGPQGTPVVVEVNVEDMIRGRGRNAERFMIRPGDTVLVEAILF